MRSVGRSLTNLEGKLPIKSVLTRINFVPFFGTATLQWMDAVLLRLLMRFAVSLRSFDWAMNPERLNVGTNSSPKNNTADSTNTLTNDNKESNEKIAEELFAFPPLLLIHQTISICFDELVYLFKVVPELATSLPFFLSILRLLSHFFSGITAVFLYSSALFFCSNILGLIERDQLIDTSHPSIRKEKYPLLPPHPSIPISCNSWHRMFLFLYQ